MYYVCVMYVCVCDVMNACMCVHTHTHTHTCTSVDCARGCISPIKVYNIVCHSVHKDRLLDVNSFTMN